MSRVDHDRTLRPISDLQDEGLLWYINRSCFHADGYALAVEHDEAGNFPGWSMLGDGTEVFAFDNATDDEKFSLVKAYFEREPVEMAPEELEEVEDE